MSSSEQSPEEMAAADRSADVKGILAIIVLLVLGAVHFASGWRFDF